MSTIEPTASPARTIDVWRRSLVQAVPRLSARRDSSPAIIAGSLLVHAGAVVGLFVMQARDAQPRPQEIPVEIVQMPPPAMPKAVSKPPAPAPKPLPPAPEKQAAKEAPKPQAKQESKPQAKPQPKPPEQRQAKTQPKSPQKSAEKQVKPEQHAKAEQQKPAPRPQPPQESVAERMKDLLGPMPGLAAAALPGESADGTEQVSYAQIVMSRIAKAKKEGRYPGVPGHASVSFVLGDNGEVTQLELVRPSGDPTLDTEAIALIKRAEPYPAPPPGGRRDYVVTLEFRAI